jgi:hypothetical protein
MVRVNGSNSVSDTKSQMQQIASTIYSKSHMKSHTCNQPLTFIPCLAAPFSSYGKVPGILPPMNDTADGDRLIALDAES